MKRIALFWLYEWKDDARHFYGYHFPLA